MFQFYLRKDINGDIFGKQLRVEDVLLIFLIYIVPTDLLTYTQLFHNRWTKFRTGVIFVPLCAVHLNMSSSEFF